MKATTRHTNVFGTVINQSSANGFRLEDDHGAWIEANIVDGYLVIEGRLGETVIDCRTLEPVCQKCKQPLSATNNSTT